MRVSKHLTAVLFLFIVNLILFGCATEIPRAVEVELMQDSKISPQKGKTVLLKRGQKFRISDRPVLVEAEGYTSIFLLPKDSGSSAQVRLQLKRDDITQGNRCEQVQDKRAQELLPVVERIQNLIAQDKKREALAKLDQVQRQFPKVTYLNFIRVSILLLLGEQAQAESLLGLTLKEFPGNEMGQELYKSIGSERKTRSISSERKK